MKFSSHKTNKGFSLVETMLASFVVIIGLVTLLQLFAPVLTSAQLSRDQVVAASLAQEGVELVRNQRDNNMLSSQAFNAGLPNGWLCLDITSSTAAGTPHSVCGGQLYQTPTGWYVHSAGGNTVTNFARRIYVLTMGQEMAVISYVKWGDGSIPSSPTSSALCTLENKCSFAWAILTDWR